MSIITSNTMPITSFFAAAVSNNGKKQHPATGAAPTTATPSAATAPNNDNSTSKSPSLPSTITSPANGKGSGASITANRMIPDYCAHFVTLADPSSASSSAVAGKTTTAGPRASCGLCNTKPTALGGLAQHVNGEVHKKKAAAHCDLVAFALDNPAFKVVSHQHHHPHHQQGKNSNSSSAATSAAAVVIPALRCFCCERTFTSLAAAADHVATSDHQKRAAAFHDVGKTSLLFKAIGRYGPGIAWACPREGKLHCTLCGEGPFAAVNAAITRHDDDAENGDVDEDNDPLRAHCLTKAHCAKLVRVTVPQPPCEAHLRSAADILYGPFIKVCASQHQSPSASTTNSKNTGRGAGASSCGEVQCRVCPKTFIPHADNTIEAHLKSQSHRHWVRKAGEEEDKAASARFPRLEEKPFGKVIVFAAAQLLIQKQQQHQQKEMDFPTRTTAALHLPGASPNPRFALFEAARAEFGDHFAVSTSKVRAAQHNGVHSPIIPFYCKLCSSSGGGSSSNAANDLSIITSRSALEEHCGSMDHRLRKSLHDTDPHLTPCPSDPTRIMCSACSVLLVGCSRTLAKAHVASQAHMTAVAKRQAEADSRLAEIRWAQRSVDASRRKFMGTGDRADMLVKPQSLLPLDAYPLHIFDGGRVVVHEFPTPQQSMAARRAICDVAREQIADILLGVGVVVVDGLMTSAAFADDSTAAAAASAADASGTAAGADVLVGTEARSAGTVTGTLGATPVAVVADQQGISASSYSSSTGIASGLRVFDIVVGSATVKPPYATNPIAAVEDRVTAYRQLCTIGIYVEEMTAIVQIATFNQLLSAKDAIKPCSNKDYSHLYEVKVPGLAEGRPSVLCGDFVTLLAAARQGSGRYDNGGTEERIEYEFEGVVHHVHSESILVSLPKCFTVRDTFDYAVTFRSSRSHYRCLHRTVESCPSEAMLLREFCVKAADTAATHTYTPLPLNLVLLPSSSSSSVASATATASPALPSPLSVSTTLLANKYNYLNEEQKAFAAHAMTGAHRLSVLWGPPGTGKTTTLVALVDTLVAASSRATILVCTPSNEASDLLVERLATAMMMKGTGGCANGAANGHHQDGTLLRIPGLSRHPNTVPTAVKPFCPPLTGDKTTFLFPSIQAVMSARVVVCTLSVADRLHSIGLPHGHFSHLIIDEAGHATESHALMALNAVGPQAKVVLAGDHKQLGPHMKTPFLTSIGMGRSPLLRIYEDTPFWEQVGCQLRECYRSDAAIVDVVNVQYDGQLRATNATPRNEYGALWQLPVVSKWWGLHCAHNNTTNICAKSNTSVGTNGSGSKSPAATTTATRVGCAKPSASSTASRANKAPAAAAAATAAPSSMASYAAMLRRSVAPNGASSTPAPTPTQPILFVDHADPEVFETQSASFQNPFEVSQIVDFVDDAFKFGAITDLSALAIITPYREQCRHLRAALDVRMTADEVLKPQMVRNPITNLLEIPMRVATVDSYQGREADIVIVSCVRSHTKNNDDDNPMQDTVCLQQQHEPAILLSHHNPTPLVAAVGVSVDGEARRNLGFLSQPERANVALSRAKKLLVVFGNRAVLELDSTWAAYMARLDAMDEGVMMRLCGGGSGDGRKSSSSAVAPVQKIPSLLGHPAATAASSSANDHKGIPSTPPTPSLMGLSSATIVGDGME